MSSEFLSKLEEIEDESFEKILISLLDTDNVEMKTEIHSPINMARLSMIASWLESENLPKCAMIIRSFITDLNIYMVSHKRQSRQEIIKALTEGLKDERKLSEKLTSPST